MRTRGLGRGSHNDRRRGRWTHREPPHMCTALSFLRVCLSLCARVRVCDARCTCECDRRFWHTCRRTRTYVSPTCVSGECVSLSARTHARTPARPPARTHARTHNPPAARAHTHEKHRRREDTRYRHEGVTLTIDHSSGGWCGGGSSTGDVGAFRQDADACQLQHYCARCHAQEMEGGLASSVRAPVRLRVSVFVRLCVCVCACVYACVRVCVCACMCVRE